MEAKYKIDDRVVPILPLKTSEFVRCKTCEGVGRVLIKEDSFECPRCHGLRGSHIEHKREWRVSTEKASLVGKIMISIGREGGCVQYMIDSTGIGTGSVWGELDLFLHTEDAQKECDKRNVPVPGMREA